ncbi:MAG: hypothetical protein V4598_00300 [Bdellovibrionota bacterium]
MKNSHLIIVVLLALAAGYFAYPYFNSNSVSSSVKTPQLEKGDSQSTVKAHPVKGDVPEIKEDVPVGDSPQTTENVDVSRNDETQNLNERNEGDDSETTSKRKSQHVPNSSTFQGIKNSLTDRDFSTYTLSKTKQRIEISPEDPRLAMIKGFYQGNFDGNQIELYIGATESSITFSENEALSFSATNERFFSNVNENGNRILIQNGDNKIFLDIKNGPGILLHMGLNTKVILVRTRRD